MPSEKGYREKCFEIKGKQCIICGKEANVNSNSHRVVVHHIDGDRTNNDIENLIPLCKSHHAEIHQNADGKLGNFFEESNEQGEDGPTDSGEMVVTTCRFEKATLENLERVAELRDMKRSELIREIIHREFKYGQADAGKRVGEGYSKEHIGRLHDHIEHLIRKL